MSASPVARQAVAHTQPKAIPRTVIINSPGELPDDVAATPGGTLFSTSPGGTRIIYERSFLLRMRNSPLAQSPPANLPVVPGVTTKAELYPPAPVLHTVSNSIPEESEEKALFYVLKIIPPFLHIIRLARQQTADAKNLQDELIKLVQ